MTKNLPSSAGTRALTDAQFHALADMPPELEWFGNITNPHTRRAYEVDVKSDFAQFVGIHQPEECRLVTRARDCLAQSLRRPWPRAGDYSPQTLVAGVVF